MFRRTFLILIVDNEPILCLYSGDDAATASQFTVWRLLDCISECGLCLKLVLVRMVSPLLTNLALVESVRSLRVRPVQTSPGLGLKRKRRDCEKCFCGS